MVTLNAYIYKPLLTAIARANDHKGLAGPMSRNRQSCENLKISFENYLGKMTNIFWEPQFWLKIFKKIPSIAANISPAKHTVNLKHRSQRHVTLRDFPNVVCSCCIIFKTKKLQRPVEIKEGFICKHCRLQHKKNLINRSFIFYLCINYLARTKKINIRMSWNHSCQR